MAFLCDSFVPGFRYVIVIFFINMRLIWQACPRHSWDDSDTVQQWAVRKVFSNRNTCPSIRLQSGAILLNSWVVSCKSLKDKTLLAYSLFYRQDPLKSVVSCPLRVVRSSSLTLGTSLQSWYFLMVPVTFSCLSLLI